MMAHNSASVQPSSIRILLVIARMHEFDICLSDVSQIYLQSTEDLGREIFIRNPAPELQLNDDH